MQEERKKERVMPGPATRKFVIPLRALFLSSTTQQFLNFPHIVLEKKKLLHMKECEKKQCL